MSPAKREVYRQFDFWVGKWDVFGRNGTKVGTNVITKDEKGFLLTEKWTNAGGGTGTSINFYDPSDKQWKQTWVDAAGNVVQYAGGFREGKMSLAGTLDQTQTGKSFGAVSRTHGTRMQVFASSSNTRATKDRLGRPILMAATCGRPSRVSATSKCTALLQPIAGTQESNVSPSCPAPRRPYRGRGWEGTHSCAEFVGLCSRIRQNLDESAIHQTLASSATLQISRWALAHGSPAKPTRSLRRVLPSPALRADSPQGGE